MNEIVPVREITREQYLHHLYNTELQLRALITNAQMRLMGLQQNRFDIYRLQMDGIRINYFVGDDGSVFFRTSTRGTMGLVPEVSPRYALQVQDTEPQEENNGPAAQEAG